MTTTAIESYLIGESPAMQRLRAQIARFAPSRLAVLIQGPTGSGKELVARALHAASRRTGSLVAFNVCAVSETMFEDAVFGHVRGAFTGATADRLGYLAEANGGTIFFDEIGGIVTGAQAKLLRAIETGSFRAVGASLDRVSDFRVISATNEPLDALVRDGRFRPDLRHRLAGVVLEVPPLLARIEDVSLLARHFLLRICPAGTVVIMPRAIRRLQGHSWPGNVRELRHTIERAAIFAERDRIDIEHIEQAIARPPEQGREAQWESGLAHQLLRALEECDWDATATGKLLGIHRATVYRRLQRFGMESRDSRSVSRDRSATSPVPRLDEKGERVADLRVT